jgi:hypothetical protein
LWPFRKGEKKLAKWHRITRHEHQINKSMHTLRCLTHQNLMIHDERKLLHFTATFDSKNISTTILWIIMHEVQALCFHQCWYWIQKVARQSMVET